MNAAYLVDNVALLSLQEKQDGVEFHCFDMNSKVQTAEGRIGWDVLDKQPFSTLEESARMAALQKIPQLDGLAVAPVAQQLRGSVQNPGWQCGGGRVSESKILNPLRIYGRISSAPWV